MIIATPSLVRRLGLEQYGVWMLIHALVGTTGVFSTGFGDATIKYVSLYRGRTDPRGMRHFLGASLAASALHGSIVGAALFLSASALVRHVFKIEPQHHASAILAIQIAALVPFLRWPQRSAAGFEYSAGAGYHVDRCPHPNRLYDPTAFGGYGNCFEN